MFDADLCLIFKRMSLKYSRKSITLFFIMCIYKCNFFVLIGQFPIFFSSHDIKKKLFLL